MQDPIIKIKNLSKFFKVPHEKRNTLKENFVKLFTRRSWEKFQALREINLEIKKGEFLGIIGPNGAGKSTLLKIIAGILQPNSGRIEIRGKISPFLELGVGFQPDLSARDNVYLYGAILGMTRKEINQKFEQIIKFAELENFVDQQLKNFSSGMQVRLAFATAIQAPADILLVDEVLAVGDLAFQRKCYDTFKKLKKQGKTIIYVSHDLNSIKQFCNKVVLLEEGKVILEGDADSAIFMYNELSMKRTKKILEGSLEKLGSGEVEINKISITNIKNKEQHIFESGDQITFRINYAVNKKVDTINFGLGIYRSDGVYFFGVNTQYDDIKIDVSHQTGEVDLIVKASLLQGSYHINLVCFGNNEALPYHFLNKASIFEVTDKKPCRGIVNLNHDWRVT